MKEWLTAAETAILVSRHISQVYRWIDTGKVTTRHNTAGILEVKTESARRCEAHTKRGRPKGTFARRI